MGSRAQFCLLVEEIVGGMGKIDDAGVWVDWVVQVVFGSWLLGFQWVEVGKEVSKDFNDFYLFVCGFNWAEYSLFKVANFGEKLMLSELDI